MFSYLTVLARVSFRTSTIIFIRLRVHAGSTIDTRMMRAAVVQIFIAQEAAPVLLTSALPGHNTGPMQTTRIRKTLVTELPLPAVVALAFSRHRTASMNQITALLADRCPTVLSHPAVKTHNISRWIAAVMAEIVISWATLFVALTPIVILITSDPNAVLNVGRDARVPDGLPVVARIYHACVNVPFDQIFFTVVLSGVIQVPGFKDECVGSRPGEVKRDDDLSHVARFAGVVFCGLKRKYISTKNVSRSRAEGALPSGGDFRLVLLQTHFKVSIALVPHAALVLRVPRAVATFPVPQLTVYIFYSNQLQLKIARGLGHLRPYR